MTTSGENADAIAATRDLTALSAVEILGAHAVDLMTAAAVKLGLYEGTADQVDLAEARNASVPHLGHHHAAPLRDGLASLQKAFREAQEYPDAPGDGPGERPPQARTSTAGPRPRQ